MAHFSEDSTYLFFSDDIDWCKKNFDQDNIIFVEAEEDIVDFYLISMCNGVILSNSSFSWWAAWLNNKNKRINLLVLWKCDLVRAVHPVVSNLIIIALTTNKSDNLIA